MDNRDLMAFVRTLDRADFIDTTEKKYSNLDMPLSIGYGQTISQPSLVWEMTALLAPDENCKVLEIGTGSGYQTAILARFSSHVYTIERIKELGDNAKERLKTLGYGNITYLIGDGSEGWNEYAPYDCIILTAAVEIMPVDLLHQLKKDGRMILPLGPRDVQELLMVSKDKDGIISKSIIEKVRFVEMKGKYGWTYNEYNNNML